MTDNGNNFNKQNVELAHLNEISERKFGILGPHGGLCQHLKDKIFCYQHRALLGHTLDSCEQ